MPARVRDALIKLDSRNVAGETRTPNVGGTLPTNFFGGPDTVIDQVKRCHDQAGIGVLDLFFQTRDADPGTLIEHARTVRREGPAAYSRRVAATLIS